MSSLDEAISRFGAAAKAKLRSAAATGEPEDQLRTPIEQLLADLADACGFAPRAIVAVGESSLSDLRTRPDYAVAAQNALVGFLEIKAPGKGADPRRYRGHDKEQWERLKSLPNLIYTDGNQFSLWRSGELQGAIVSLVGDVESTGASLGAPPALLALFNDFFRWSPTPPRSPRQLAEISARLCRLLRDEVTEQLDREHPSLTALAGDWRKLLFPDASNAQFADGYAQAVTFGLLVARARQIDLFRGLGEVGRQLGQTNSLIGAALRLLTDDVENQQALKTSLGTLVRVLDVVHWDVIGQGDPDAWLYFYEHFLEVYDNRLRKQTGSYYTPPEVVGAMVELADEALRSERFSRPRGLASPDVTVADPAVGTGTFLLGALRRIAATVSSQEGEGAVPAAIDASLERILGFELQLGPFAVAQLRLIAELTELLGRPPVGPLQLYVADTLSNPYEELEWIPHMLDAIAESRRQANEIKKNARITVVIGNPPYKEKAKGRGGWIEAGGANTAAPLLDWMPPRDWGVGAHAKHLRNLYVYFWRWATWKVFDQRPETSAGIVCFITVAGFLNGPGFEKMRDYLRRKCDDVWVIDCSPDGHQPEVSTRIFEGVQQPVCIVMAVRSPSVDESEPAAVHFHALPEGPRRDKFAALAALTLSPEAWRDCPSDWRAPFLPAAGGAWAAFPRLEDLFVYNGSGVMPGRTWVIAPDAESLTMRWNTLIHAPASEKETLFHPHLRKGKPGDRHVLRVVRGSLAGFEERGVSVAEDRGAPIPPVPYGFRSFDRQWIIPDNRLINQPNPELWAIASADQVYLTAPTDRSPSNGPAISFSADVPDLHHYAGRGGRVFPLWRNREGDNPNIRTTVLETLANALAHEMTAEALFAYVAGIAAHPAYTSRFSEDLLQPGLRIPITLDASLFSEVAEVGRIVIWLHTYGERFADPALGRPHQAPRLAPAVAPRMPAGGAIPNTPDGFPDSIDYDPATRRLRVGSGYVDNVTPEMWAYEVSGKQVIRQWFSYRRMNRERPIIGDRRPPSKLGDIQPERWPAEYTTDLIDLLNVLGRLVELEPRQAELLNRVCSGALLSAAELPKAEKVQSSRPSRAKAASADQHELLD